MSSSKYGVFKLIAAHALRSFPWRALAILVPLSIVLVCGSVMPSVKCGIWAKAGPDLEMVQIPAGEFLMGSPAGEGGKNERPQHKVYLDAYSIGRNEVTNEEYERFVKSTDYVAEGKWREHAGPGKEKHPVVCVTWNDAMAYCRWAGGSLPTEAQWEKAARGTGGRIYPWGNSWDASRCNNKGKGTTAAGSCPEGASPYGVQDMAGNVWEWCFDWYDEGYYGSSPSKNPEGGKSGEYRSIRGSSWRYANADLFRCAYRLRIAPDHWFDSLGFRLCRASGKS